MMNQRFAFWALTLAMAATSLPAAVEVVSGPNLARTNTHYISNRAPLKASQFIGLPVGSVEPRGWVREFLRRQRDGLTGHLGEISAWLQKEDNAWLSKDGKGKYGWEELPYWLKGYIELAHIFDDPKMIAECQIWIEGTLASQRADGDFGPNERFQDGSRDYWANMVMLFCLQTHYERTQDPRVLELMYWPVLQMVVWGFITAYLAGVQQNTTTIAAGVLLGGVLLWEITLRSQMGFAISFLEEVWSRNLGHIFVSPLRPWEMVAGLAAMSVLRTVAAVLPAMVLAFMLYGFGVWKLGPVWWSSSSR